MIASVYQNVIQQLKNELGATTCFSVMMDEVSDHSHKEQVSVVVRYVDNDFIIQERLIGIECVESTDAETLFQTLLNSFSIVGLTTDNLIGQCYDGANNMCGHIAGVQAKVKAIQPNAIYTHCYAHCTNLILVEANSRNFWGLLQNLYTFLEGSPHQHAKLEKIIKQVNSKPCMKSIKKLSDTRWACRSCCSSKLTLLLVYLMCLWYCGFAYFAHLFLGLLELV